MIENTTGVTAYNGCEMCYLQTDVV